MLKNCLETLGGEIAPVLSGLCSCCFCGLGMLEVVVPVLLLIAVSVPLVLFFTWEGLAVLLRPAGLRLLSDGSINS